MEQKMIIIYRLIEEFLTGVMCKQEHKLSKIRDAEVLFMGYNNSLNQKELKASA